MRRPGPWLGLLLAVTCTLAAGRWGLWRAELFTWRVSRGSVDELVEAVVEDKHPLGYFGLSWLLGRLGEGDLLLRLPSALAAGLLVVAMAALGRRLGGARLAWALGLITCLHPVVLLAGLTARSTALVTLWSALLLHALVDLAQGHRRAPWLLGLLAATGLQLHYSFSGPLLAAVLAVPLLARRSEGAGARGLLLRGWGGLAVGAATFLPWYLWATRSQMAAERPVERSLAILRYLAWPVGQRVFLLLALAGLVLALLGLLRARRGEGPAWALLAASAVAGVAWPYAISHVAEAWWKFYLYAPLLPAFLLAVGLGLVGLLAEGGPRRLVGAALGLGLLGGLLQAQHSLTRLESSPMAPWDREPGVRDVRVEVEVLREVLGGRTLPTHGSLTAHRRYAPELFTGAHGSLVSWSASHRLRSELRLVTSGDAECSFEVAFTPVLAVWPREDCRALREAMARWPEVGPFLLEEALILARQGRLEEAEVRARQAAAGMPASTLPWLLLGRIAWARGDEAMLRDAVSSGVTVGQRWTGGRTLEPIALLSMRLEQGPDEHAELEAWRGCVTSTEPSIFCDTVLAGSDLSRWLGHVQEPGAQDAGAGPHHLGGPSSPPVRGGGSPGPGGPR